MTLFRLDASIRTEGSHSRQIADIVQQEWRNAHPRDPVVNREIGTEPLPANAWATAVFAPYTPEEDRSPEQREAIALAATLADELTAADAFLFAVPLYNFGVSQHFKTWVDLVVTDPRMGAGSDPVLAGRPAVLATVHGGAYGQGTPREGWDHATPWMRRILEDVWKLDLRVVGSEFTLVGVNPQLDEFKEIAAEMRIEAEELARAHGRSLSAELAA
ncbi:MAG TPA: NAD(P)H-dependent oxidoreductase [Solirubrobacteraceae bacterium]|jgi:FMN-dependent NADH-azoreductase|nr:NAD(P)H-dependent oxidoreductase [Solirubrobacteraceae bacterium]